jgi:hypothetical protein
LKPTAQNLNLNNKRAKPLQPDNLSSGADIRFIVITADIVLPPHPEIANYYYFVNFFLLYEGNNL